MNLRVIVSIYKKELHSYFCTPVGYVFMAIFLLVSGHTTFDVGRGNFFALRLADLNAFFNYVPWLFVLFVPSVTMRLWSEESKSGSIELLFSLPITHAEAAIAKLLAAWTFISSTLVGTLPLVFTVYYLGKPDLWQIIMGYASCIFLAGLFVSVGLFFSAISKKQVISFILTTLFCYFLLIAANPSILNLLSGILPNHFLTIFESLSALNHFESMIRGVIGLDDFWYFALTISYWLSSCCFILDMKKGVREI